jgi:hypothetical protein
MALMVAIVHAMLGKSHASHLTRGVASAKIRSAWPTSVQRQPWLAAQYTTVTHYDLIYD